MDYVDMSSRVDQGELGESLARMHLATPVVPDGQSRCRSMSPPETTTHKATSSHPGKPPMETREPERSAGQVTSHPNRRDLINGPATIS